MFLNEEEERKKKREKNSEIAKRNL